MNVAISPKVTKQCQHIKNNNLLSLLKHISMPLLVVKRDLYNISGLFITANSFDLTTLINLAAPDCPTCFSVQQR